VGADKFIILPSTRSFYKPKILNQMKKLESLSNSKFKKLSKEEIEKINGGNYIVIYANQKMATGVGSDTGGTGDYGYYSFLGIRVTSNGFRVTDEYNENASVSGSGTTMPWINSTTP
jgi:hypothetical protein